MKKRKSYFIRTFHINEVILFLLMVVILIRVPFKLIELCFSHKTTSILVSYSKIMTRVIEEISNALDWMIVLSVVALLIFLVPELVTRIAKDSIINWFYSIWVSFRLRRFLVRQVDHEGEEIYKINQYNRSIQKSIIDIRKRNVTYLIKLPNDVQAQKLILNTKDIIHEEITSQFSDYSFSNFERYKHWMRIEGTKMR